jgi:hypothetical protein
MNARLAPIPLLVAFTAAALCALSSVVPLTYDEGFNYGEISRHGFAFTWAYDTYPNNHMLFTLLQGLMPTSLVDAHPHLLRVPNLVYLALLMALLWRALAPLGAARGWLAVALLLAGPYFTLYTLVGRGYLLGTMLSLGAAVALVERRAALGGVLAGLAGATVPTFAFLLPGMLLAHLAIGPWKERLREGGLFSLPAVAAMGATWFPHRAALSAHGQKWGLQWRPFIEGAVETLGNHPVLSGAGVVAAVALVATARKVKLPHLAWLVWAGLASFLLLTVALSAAGRSNAPYVRGAAPLALLVWLGLALALGERGALVKRAGLALVGANAVFGLAVLLMTFGPAGDLSRFPGLAELNPTAAERLVAVKRGEQVDAVEGVWAASPVGILYARSLGLAWREVPPTAGPAECAFGARPPVQELSRIWVVQGETRRLVCFP